MTTATALPGLVTGTWVVDPAHTEIAFTVRHLMTKVRGRFTQFEGTVTVGDDLTSSAAEATIQLASVDTGTKQRDDHLRSSDFFDAEQQPTMTYRSKALHEHGEGYVAVGDLTVKAVTREVELAVELLGVGTDAYGNERIGLEATGQISRKDFGIDFNMPLDGDKLLIGDLVTITLTVQAVHQAA
ncbi:MAG: polyisoprenoid-binding protein [Nocardioidaceae bacterium]|nr:polyisoprenoid-binding protein [Nocardioidaceae bacterium]